jgi:hypothetical protein
VVSSNLYLLDKTINTIRNIEYLLDSGDNADIEVNTGEIITLYNLSTKYKTKSQHKGR